ncbi:MAG: alpha/beta hydrolase [Chloroflexi bacterium]|nr:alpha/beta hydrolase [Chloroflexota bacterium]
MSQPQMSQSSSFVVANGIKHHILEMGERSRPPVMMVHATGLCAYSWLPIARNLARDYFVMALDQRGHGDTEPSECGYSFEMVGNDLKAIIETLDLKGLRVVGHSSGGLASLMAASQLSARIVQTCLVETRVGESPANAPPGELYERARRTRMKRAIWESRQAMYEAYRKRPAFRNWTEEAFGAFINGGARALADGRVELKCHPDVEATFYEQRDSLQVSHYFDGLQGGFLLLLGDYPEAQTLQDVGVKRFLEGVPGARVKPMGMGSHFLPMEHPGEVTAEVSQFFGSGENIAS